MNICQKILNLDHLSDETPWVLFHCRSHKYKYLYENHRFHGVKWIPSVVSILDLSSENTSTSMDAPSDWCLQLLLFQVLD